MSSMWPEETLQRHPQSHSKGFRHTNRVLETDCAGTIKVAKDQLSMKKICEAERKRRERKAKTDGPRHWLALLATDSLELELA